MSDSEQLRVLYEGIVKQNPSNTEAVHYLAVWHLERHSFQQARKYFGHLATLKPDDADVWLCLSVCCAMAEEFDECLTSLLRATNLIDKKDRDVRVKFCQALMQEKQKDYPTALDAYLVCLNDCTNATGSDEKDAETSNGQGLPHRTIGFMRELRGEIMLRIAMLRKETGAFDLAMQTCNNIASESFGDSVKANALCLKGLLHEMRSEFPASEVVYRAALQIMTGHSTALERLGRVYLRYRETIPAAVQCFFKSVETNPSNHVAWYLLGRCYMATAQYSDACEAYNRAVNLNPNDPQVWCSLGVLYYAFGQYREALGMLARALKLDPTMADAWYNVGALYDMCDQGDDAQQAYMMARENGLADRFARAGMGLNPLAMQSLQFAAANGANTTAATATGANTGTGTGSTSSSSSSSSSSGGGVGLSSLSGMTATVAVAGGTMSKASSSQKLHQPQPQQQSALNHQPVQHQHQHQPHQQYHQHQQLQYQSQPQVQSQQTYAHQPHPGGSHTVAMHGHGSGMGLGSASFDYSANPLSQFTL